MDHFIVDETGTPLRFPDPREEARARAEEFARLSPEERLKEIASLMESGLAMVKSSPRRAAIEQRWLDQEAEWQRIQQTIWGEHAS